MVVLSGVQQKQQKDLQAVLEGVTNYVPSGAQGALIAGAIMSMHPTLQQQFWGSLLKAMGIIVDEGYFDLRNEASKELLKKLIESGEGVYLPFI